MELVRINNRLTWVISKKALLPSLRFQALHSECDVEEMQNLMLELPEDPPGEWVPGISHNRARSRERLGELRGGGKDSDDDIAVVAVVEKEGSENKDGEERARKRRGGGEDSDDDIAVVAVVEKEGSENKDGEERARKRRNRKKCAAEDKVGVQAEGGGSVVDCSKDDDVTVLAVIDQTGEPDVHRSRRRSRNGRGLSVEDVQRQLGAITVKTVVDKLLEEFTDQYILKNKVNGRWLVEKNSAGNKEQSSSKIGKCKDGSENAASGKGAVESESVFHNEKESQVEECTVVYCTDLVDRRQSLEGASAIVNKEQSHEDCIPSTSLCNTVYEKGDKETSVVIDRSPVIVGQKGKNLTDPVDKLHPEQIENDVIQNGSPRGVQDRGEMLDSPSPTVHRRETLNVDENKGVMVINRTSINNQIPVKTAKERNLSAIISRLHLKTGHQIRSKKKSINEVFTTIKEHKSIASETVISVEEDRVELSVGNNVCNKKRESKIKECSSVKVQSPSVTINKERCRAGLVKRWGSGQINSTEKKEGSQITVSVTKNIVQETRKLVVGNKEISVKNDVHRMKGETKTEESSSIKVQSPALTVRKGRNRIFKVKRRSIKLAYATENKEKIQSEDYVTRVEPKNLVKDTGERLEGVPSLGDRTEISEENDVDQEKDESSSIKERSRTVTVRKARNRTVVAKRCSIKLANATENKEKLQSEDCVTRVEPKNLVKDAGKGLEGVPPLGDRTEISAENDVDQERDSTSSIKEISPTVTVGKKRNCTVMARRRSIKLANATENKAKIPSENCVTRIEPKNLLKDTGERLEGVLPLADRTEISVGNDVDQERESSSSIKERSPPVTVEKRKNCSGLVNGQGSEPAITTENGKGSQIKDYAAINKLQSSVQEIGDTLDGISVLVNKAGRLMRNDMGQKEEQGKIEKHSSVKDESLIISAKKGRNRTVLAKTQTVETEKESGCMPASIDKTGMSMGNDIHLEKGERKVWDGLRNILHKICENVVDIPALMDKNGMLLGYDIDYIGEQEQIGECSSVNDQSLEVSAKKESNHTAVVKRLCSEQVNVSDIKKGNHSEDCITVNEHSQDSGEKHISELAVGGLSTVNDVDPKKVERDQNPVVTVKNIHTRPHLVKRLRSEIHTIHQCRGRTGPDAAIKGLKLFSECSVVLERLKIIPSVVENREVMPTEKHVDHHDSGSKVEYTKQAREQEVLRKSSALSNGGIKTEVINLAEELEHFSFENKSTDGVSAAFVNQYGTDVNDGRGEEMEAMEDSSVGKNSQQKTIVDTDKGRATLALEPSRTESVSDKSVAVNVVCEQSMTDTSVDSYQRSTGELHVIKVHENTENVLRPVVEEVGVLLSEKEDERECENVNRIEDKECTSDGRIEKEIMNDGVVTKPKRQIKKYVVAGNANYLKEAEDKRTDGACTAGSERRKVVMENEVLKMYSIEKKDERKTEDTNKIDEERTVEEYVPVIETEKKSAEDQVLKETEVQIEKYEVEEKNEYSNEAKDKRMDEEDTLGNNKEQLIVDNKVRKQVIFEEPKDMNELKNKEKFVEHMNNRRIKKQIVSDRSVEEVGEIEKHLEDKEKADDTNETSNTTIAEGIMSDTQSEEVIVEDEVVLEGDAANIPKVVDDEFAKIPIVDEVAKIHKIVVNEVAKILEIIQKELIKIPGAVDVVAKIPQIVEGEVLKILQMVADEVVKFPEGKIENSSMKVTEATSEMKDNRIVLESMLDKKMKGMFVDKVEKKEGELIGKEDARESRDTKQGKDKIMVAESTPDKKREMMDVEDKIEMQSVKKDERETEKTELKDKIMDGECSPERGKERLIVKDKVLKKTEKQNEKEGKKCPSETKAKIKVVRTSEEKKKKQTVKNKSAEGMKELNEKSVLGKEGECKIVKKRKREVGEFFTDMKEKQTLRVCVGGEKMGNINKVIKVCTVENQGQKSAGVETNEGRLKKTVVLKEVHGLFKSQIDENEQSASTETAGEEKNEQLQGEEPLQIKVETETDKSSAERMSSKPKFRVQKRFRSDDGGVRKIEKGMAEEMRKRKFEKYLAEKKRAGLFNEYIPENTGSQMSSRDEKEEGLCENICRVMKEEPQIKKSRDEKSAEDKNKVKSSLEKHRPGITRERMEVLKVETEKNKYIIKMMQTKKNKKKGEVHIENRQDKEIRENKDPKEITKHTHESKRSLTKHYTVNEEARTLGDQADKKIEEKVNEISGDGVMKMMGESQGKNVTHESKNEVQVENSAQKPVGTDEAEEDIKRRGRSTSDTEATAESKDVRPAERTFIEQKKSEVEPAINGEIPVERDVILKGVQNQTEVCSFAAENKILNEASLVTRESNLKEDAEIIGELDEKMQQTVDNKVVEDRQELNSEHKCVQIQKCMIVKDETSGNRECVVVEEGDGCDKVTEEEERQINRCMLVHKSMDQEYKETDLSPGMKKGEILSQEQKQGEDVTVMIEGANEIQDYVVQKEEERENEESTEVIKLIQNGELISRNGERQSRDSTVATEEKAEVQTCVHPCSSVKEGDGEKEEYELLSDEDSVETLCSKLEEICREDPVKEHVMEEEGETETVKGKGRPVSEVWRTENEGLSEVQLSVAAGMSDVHVRPTVRENSLETLCSKLEEILSGEVQEFKEEKGKTEAVTNIEVCGTGNEGLSEVQPPVAAEISDVFVGPTLREECAVEGEGNGQSENQYVVEGFVNAEDSGQWQAEESKVVEDEECRTRSKTHVDVQESAMAEEQQNEEEPDIRKKVQDGCKENEKQFEERSESQENVEGSVVVEEERQTVEVEIKTKALGEVGEGVIIKEKDVEKCAMLMEGEKQDKDCEAGNKPQEGVEECALVKERDKQNESGIVNEMQGEVECAMLEEEGKRNEDCNVGAGVERSVMIEEKTQECGVRLGEVLECVRARIGENKDRATENSTRKVVEETTKEKEEYDFGNRRMAEGEFDEGEVVTGGEGQNEGAGTENEAEEGIKSKAEERSSMEYVLEKDKIGGLTVENKSQAQFENTVVMGELSADSARQTIVENEPLKCLDVREEEINKVCESSLDTKDDKEMDGSTVESQQEVKIGDYLPDGNLSIQVESTCMSDDKVEIPSERSDSEVECQTVISGSENQIAVCTIETEGEEKIDLCTIESIRQFIENTVEGGKVAHTGLGIIDNLEERCGSICSVDRSGKRQLCVCGIENEGQVCSFETGGENTSHLEDYTVGNGGENFTCSGAVKDNGNGQILLCSVSGGDEPRVLKEHTVDGNNISISMPAVEADTPVRPCLADIEVERPVKVCTIENESERHIGDCPVESGLDQGVRCCTVEINRVIEAGETAEVNIDMGVSQILYDEEGGLITLIQNSDAVQTNVTKSSGENGEPVIEVHITEDEEQKGESDFESEVEQEAENELEEEVLENVNLGGTIIEEYVDKDIFENQIVIRMEGVEAVQVQTPDAEPGIKNAKKQKGKISSGVRQSKPQKALQNEETRKKPRGRPKKSTLVEPDSEGLVNNVQQNASGTSVNARIARSWKSERDMLEGHLGAQQNSNADIDPKKIVLMEDGSIFRPLGLITKAMRKEFPNTFQMNVPPVGALERKFEGKWKKAMISKVMNKEAQLAAAELEKALGNDPSERSAVRKGIRRRSRSQGNKAPAMNVDREPVYTEHVWQEALGSPVIFSGRKALGNDPLQRGANQNDGRRSRSQGNESSAMSVNGREPAYTEHIWREALMSPVIIPGLKEARPGLSEDGMDETRMSPKKLTYETNMKKIGDLPGVPEQRMVRRRMKAIRQLPMKMMFERFKEIPQNLKAEFKTKFLEHVQLMRKIILTRKDLATGVLQAGKPVNVGGTQILSIMTDSEEDEIIPIEMDKNDGTGAKSTLTQAAQPHVTTSPLKEVTDEPMENDFKKKEVGNVLTSNSKPRSKKSRVAQPPRKLNNEQKVIVQSVLCSMPDVSFTPVENTIVTNGLPECDAQTMMVAENLLSFGQSQSEETSSRELIDSGEGHTLIEVPPELQIVTNGLPECDAQTMMVAENLLSFGQSQLEETSSRELIDSGEGHTLIEVPPELQDVAIGLLESSSKEQRNQDEAPESNTVEASNENKYPSTLGEKEITNGEVNTDGPTVPLVQHKDQIDKPQGKKNKQKKKKIKVKEGGDSGRKSNDLALKQKGKKNAKTFDKVEESDVSNIGNSARPSVVAPPKKIITANFKAKNKAVEVTSSKKPEEDPKGIISPPKALEASITGSLQQKDTTCQLVNNGGEKSSADKLSINKTPRLLDRSILPLKPIDNDIINALPSLEELMGSSVATLSPLNDEAARNNGDKKEGEKPLPTLPLKKKISREIQNKATAVEDELDSAVAEQKVRYMHALLLTSLRATSPESLQDNGKIIETLIGSDPKKKPSRGDLLLIDMFTNSVGKVSERQKPVTGKPVVKKSHISPVVPSQTKAAPDRSTENGPKKIKSQRLICIDLFKKEKDKKMLKKSDKKDVSAKASPKEGLTSPQHTVVKDGSSMDKVAESAEIRTTVTENHAVNKLDKVLKRNHSQEEVGEGLSAKKLKTESKENTASAALSVDSKTSDGKKRVEKERRKSVQSIPVEGQEGHDAKKLKLEFKENTASSKLPSLSVDSKKLDGKKQVERERRKSECKTVQNTPVGTTDSNSNKKTEKITPVVDGSCPAQDEKLPWCSNETEVARVSGTAESTADSSSNKKTDEKITPVVDGSCPTQNEKLPWCSNETEVAGASGTAEGTTDSSSNKKTEKIAPVVDGSCPTQDEKLPRCSNDTEVAGVSGTAEDVNHSLPLQQIFRLRECFVLLHRLREDTINSIRPFRRKSKKRKEIDTQGDVPGAEDQTSTCDNSASLERLSPSTKENISSPLPAGEEEHSCPQSPSKKQLHVCEVCGERFLAVSILHAHLKKHSQEEASSPDKNMVLRRNPRTPVRKTLSHHCPYCFKKFRGKKNFVRHLKQHSDEKPCKCYMCDKTFLTYYNLFVHMRTHTKEHPYPCYICQKTFAHSTTLKIHIKKNHVKKQFKCFSCERSFLSVVNRSAHMKKCHENEPV